MSDEQNAECVTAFVVLLQVLAWIGGRNELILRTGEPVLLKTAPVDPDDPFAGSMFS